MFPLVGFVLKMHSELLTNLFSLTANAIKITTVSPEIDHLSVLSY